MSTYLRIVLGIVVICYISLIVHFIKKKTLSLKYSLVWLFSGAAMAVFVISPGLLGVIMKFIGVELTSNGLFLSGIFFVAIVSMSLTAIVSGQTERIKNLAQNSAILEKRIRELEEKLEALKENNK